MRSTVYQLVAVLTCAGLPLVASTSVQAQEPAGQPPLTVESAVARALEQPAVERAAESRRTRARAEQRAESAFGNPELEFEHEQLLGGGAETEDALSLAKTFELSGGRRLRQQAAGHRRRAVDAENAARIADLEAEVRLAFYRVLHAQQQQVAIATWVGRLERTVGDAEARAAAGDASEYDRLRFRRELARARAELARVEATRDRQWAELAGWIGADPAADQAWPRVAGELVPVEPAPEAARLIGSIEDSPELEALDARAAAAGDRASAAGRAWVPELTLSAGYKTAATAGVRAHGFVVGLGAPLPLLNQGRGEQAAAAAERAELLAERELAAGRRLAALHGLAAAADRLQRLAREQRPEIAGEAARLLAAAEAAYRGGEIGALELVDAYGSHLEGELQLQEIELAAREARIGLERLLEGTTR